MTIPHWRQRHGTLLVVVHAPAVRSAIVLAWLVSACSSRSPEALAWQSAIDIGRGVAVRETSALDARVIDVAVDLRTVTLSIVGLGKERALSRMAPAGALVVINGGFFEPDF